MPAGTIAYIISHIKQNIPEQVLSLCFEPQRYNTTVEQRIIQDIIEGPILLDTNLVAGKRRNIFIQSSWELNFDFESSATLVGTGVQSAYYKVPPEARENRNIASVIGIEQNIEASIPGTGPNFNGNGGFGNSITSLTNQMLNTRTFAQVPISPIVTLEGTNILCFSPRSILDGIAVSVMLEYDAEFLNLSPSAILALQELCLCAVQRYIYTKLRVVVDETQIVAGMEIGAIKDIVNECGQKAENYHDLLKRFKGAAHYDRRTLNRLIGYGL